MKVYLVIQDHEIYFATSTFEKAKEVEEQIEGGEILMNETTKEPKVFEIEGNTNNVFIIAEYFENGFCKDIPFVSNIESQVDSFLSKNNKFGKIFLKHELIIDGPIDIKFDENKESDVEEI